jgi:hypothetical protein
MLIEAQLRAHNKGFLDDPSLKVNDEKGRQILL